MAVERFYKRHAACFNQGDKHKLDLQLLLACRQIHNEAALVHFACNTFLVDTNCLRFFVASLKSVQLAQLKMLSLVHWSTASTVVLNLLGHLKSFSILYEYATFKRFATVMAIDLLVRHGPHIVSADASEVAFVCLDIVGAATAQNGWRQEWDPIVVPDASAAVSRRFTTIMRENHRLKLLLRDV